MDPIIISALFSKVESQLVSIAGPAPAAGYSVLRAKAGLSDQAASRAAGYYGERAAVANRGKTGYAPVIPDPHALIRLYHQGANVDALGLLPNFGIDMTADNGAAGTSESDAWANIVAYAATAAPLDYALRASRRAGKAPEGETTEAAIELDFHLHRAGFSRQGDKDLIVAPYYHWSTHDAQRLAWMGLVDAGGYSRLVAAAGCVMQSDADFALYLSQYYPSADQVAKWDTRGLLDLIANGDEFGFLGNGGSAKGVYYAGIHGVGVGQTPLPGEPAGAPNWYDLIVKANRPIPGFGEMRVMSHRLRPSPDGGGKSVVKNAPAWTNNETRAALRLHGYADSIIDRLVGLVPEPINIRIINHVLTETLKHKELTAAAQAVMGEGVDWVKNAFLDHGFTDAVATVTANAFRQSAWDSANAERLELQKQIRAEGRRAVLEQYELGLLPTDNAVLGLQDDFVDAEMALQMLEQIDDKIRTEYVKVATGEVRNAFLAGKLSVEQVGGQLGVLGVNAARQAYYIQQWVWEKNDRQRMLATGEILAALKRGLLTADAAYLRLVNVGWTAPDAMIEVAIIENDLIDAAQKTATAEENKRIAEQLKAQREAQAEAKRQAAEQARQARDILKHEQEAMRLPLEQAAAVNKYAAEALHQLALYNKAAAKKDQLAMDEAVDRAAAAYQELVALGYKGEQLFPEVTNVVSEIVPVAIPQPPESEGTGPAPAAPTPKPGSAPDAGGGPGNPPTA